MRRILFIFGTRPEAIKLCPVIRRMQSAGFDVSICLTGQHREMVDPVLECFGIRPDLDLDLMKPGQTLAQVTSGVLSALDPILAADSFGMAVVQGDTTTAMAGAMAAFYHRLPVAHVEAGLRTGDLTKPFPEELNRLVVGRLATLHFAPTTAARDNLLSEGIPAGRVTVTGNSGIDAVLHVAAALERGELSPPEWPWINRAKKLIVVTAHRRESFGDGIVRICSALSELAQRDDVQIVYPVHRNPNVLDPVTARLTECPNIALVEPLDYPCFIDLMRRAHVLITDSGGIQEEAPSLGKPVIVMRDCTERPEAVAVGTVKLVGTDPGRIVSETERLLTDAAEYRRMSRIHNPYGDGRASERIEAAIAQFLAEN